MNDIEIRNRVRSTNRHWPESMDSEPLFAGSVTLDPNIAPSAWSRLSVSTWELELSEYPRLFHQALIEALRKKIDEPGREQR